MNSKIPETLKVSATGLLATVSALLVWLIAVPSAHA